MIDDPSKGEEVLVSVNCHFRLFAHSYLVPDVYNVSCIMWFDLVSLKDIPKVTTARKSDSSKRTERSSRSFCVEYDLNQSFGQHFSKFMYLHQNSRRFSVKSLSMKGTVFWN